MAFALLLLMVAIVLLNAAFSGRSIPEVIRGALNIDSSKRPTFSVKGGGKATNAEGKGGSFTPTQRRDPEAGGGSNFGAG